MRWLLVIGLLAGCKRVHSSGGPEPDAAGVDVDAPIPNADFVVNTSLYDDQFLSADAESSGVQLATADGLTWTIAFRHRCTYCSIYARRFDASGNAIPFGSAQQTEEIVVSKDAMADGATPAVAGIFDTTLVVWDHTDAVTSEQRVACIPLDRRGETTNVPGQPTIATEPADAVAASPLSSGDFVVTWQSRTTPPTLRAAIVDPDCFSLRGASTISDYAGLMGPRGLRVANNGSYMLYAWVVDGDVHIRPGLTGGSVGNERVLLYQSATERATFIDVVPWEGGFALAARWSSGRIDMYHLGLDGQVGSDPYLVTIQSGSGSAADQAFAMTARWDGLLLLVWHVCPTGTASCDVLGTYVRPDGSRAAYDFMIPTTTAGAQTQPSALAVGDQFVVAWTDSSATKPDDSGSSVRARIIRP